MGNALIGAQPIIALMVDAGGMPAAAGVPPAPSSANLTPTVARLTHVTAAFSGCAVDGRPLAPRRAMSLAPRPSGPPGVLTPSPLSAGGSFVLSYRAP